MNGLMNTIGIIGNVLLVFSYFPQIYKLIKTKRGEDLSQLMWLNYLVGDLLLAAYSYYTKDYIFFSLFVLFTFCNITVLYLTIKYSKKQVTAPPQPAYNN